MGKLSLILAKILVVSNLWCISGVEASDYTERVFVLVTDSAGLLHAEEIRSGLLTRGELQTALSQPGLGSAAYYFHNGFRTRNPVESSLEGRMARMLVVPAASIATAQQLVRDLDGIFSIEIALVDNGLASAFPGGENPDLRQDGTIPLDCRSDPLAVPLDYSHVNKIYAQQMTRLQQGLELSRGNAMIASVDYGLDQTHPNLVDFAGSVFLGGGFHQHMAVDFGGREFDNASQPFGAGAVFGWADEYNWLAVDEHPQYPTWLNCDDSKSRGGDGDETIQSEFVGHGTHVAGLLIGTEEPLSGWMGFCPGCSLSALRSQKGDGSCRGTFPDPMPTQPNTNPPQSFEISPLGVDWPIGIAIAVDVGAQVINLSGGRTGFPHSYHCEEWMNTKVPACMAITYAESRDSIIVAAAGNSNDDFYGIDWPAKEPRVVGVTGTTSNGNRWDSGVLCGSNYARATNDEGHIYSFPTFAAPAVSIYSTMYPNTNYQPLNCHVGSDSNPVFGYCTGTSMSTPIVAGIIGLVRSVMPLASKESVIEAVRSSTPTAALPQDRQLGWGIPRADYAIERMLGISNSEQLVNRLTPLFNLYSSAKFDFFSTTRPQSAVAFASNTDLLYEEVLSSQPVEGFDFEFMVGGSFSVEPRADVYLFTTHAQIGSNVVAPLYRMRKTTLNNIDSLLVLETELVSYQSSGFELEGIEGFLFPSTGDQPAGTVKLYRVYNPAPSVADHAVVGESRLAEVQAAGYNSSPVLLGYAFPNVDTDSDGIIDGSEVLLGTDPNRVDTNCDGVEDSHHYPPFGLPVSDPVAVNGCEADLELSATQLSDGRVRVRVLNYGPKAIEQFSLHLAFENNDFGSDMLIEDSSVPACQLTSSDSYCPSGGCTVTYECSLSSPLTVWSSAFFHFTGISDSVQRWNHLELNGRVVAADPFYDPNLANNNVNLSFFRLTQ